MIIAVSYSVQIYTDFAGYSAIVIGISQILGYKIPENFIAPYRAKNIKEFWGRWHISLSTWLKDYIYIPLGGNRKGNIRKYINILLTFLVSGLWHGLQGHFLLWGGLHGVYQIFGDITKGIRSKMFPYCGVKDGSYFHNAIKRLFTFLIVTVAWIFFRTGVSDSITYIKEICTDPGIMNIKNGMLWETGLSPFWWFVIMVSVFVVNIFEKYFMKKI